MKCEECGKAMETQYRLRRMTFAGWEPACTQHYCADCGSLYEAVTPEDMAEFERLGGHGPLPAAFKTLEIS